MKIYRKGNIIADILLDDTSTHTHTIMGEEVCTIVHTSKILYDFTVGDFLYFQGVVYTINIFPNITKTANDSFTYTLKFESVKYDLSKIICKIDEKTEFPISADAKQIIDLVVQSMNNYGSVWKRGTYSLTEFKQFQFTNKNCLQVLTEACTAFDVEFEVVVIDGDNVINIRDVIGINNGKELSYKNGIYSLSKTLITDRNHTTKLIPFGSSKNLPPEYTWQRLHIPPIERNVLKYGIFENVKIFDDIYPNFTGTIQSIQQINVFSDFNIDFDINTQLIPGVTAKIVFLSGNLAGYEFEINAFDNSTKQVALNFLIDDTNRNLPGEIESNTNLQIGDKYTIIDIFMPQSYIDSAENDLSIAANKYIDKYANPMYKYAVEIDNRYVRKHELQISTGERLFLFDSDFNIYLDLRVYSVTKSMADPYKYKLELTDNLQTSRMLDFVNEQYNINQKLEILRKELLIFKKN